MKVRVTERKGKEEMPYPKLMEGVGGSIVLMHKEGCGTLLIARQDSTNKLGEYIQDWTMSSFTDFEGKLELSNK